MCNEVSHASDVEKGLGAVVLPEAALHEPTLFDQFADLKGGQACSIEGGFGLGGVRMLLGAVAIAGGVGRPELELSEGVVQALKGISAFSLAPATCSDPLRNGGVVGGLQIQLSRAASFSFTRRRAVLVSAVASAIIGSESKYCRACSNAEIESR